MFSCIISLALCVLPYTQAMFMPHMLDIDPPDRKVVKKDQFGIPRVYDVNHETRIVKTPFGFKRMNVVEYSDPDPILPGPGFGSPLGGATGNLNNFMNTIASNFLFPNQPTAPPGLNFNNLQNTNQILNSLSNNRFSLNTANTNNQLALNGNNLATSFNLFGQRNVNNNALSSRSVSPSIGNLNPYGNQMNTLGPNLNGLGNIFGTSGSATNPGLNLNNINKPFPSTLNTFPAGSNQQAIMRTLTSPVGR